MRRSLLKRMLSRFEVIRETRHCDVHLQYRLLEENEQLKADLRKMSNILNILPFPIWVRNKELEITFQNMAYIQFIEKEAEQEESDTELLFEHQAKNLAEKAQKS